MSYTLRTARVAYDNIAVASATGKERTISGSAGSTERPSGGSLIITADGHTSAPESSSEPTSNARNRLITSTGGVTTLPPRETMINTN